MNRIHEAIPLEGTAEDSPTVRAAARAIFRRASCSEDLAGDGLLCLSELVTNALLHAGGAICAEVTATATAVRLEVTDGMPPEESPDLVASAAARALIVEDVVRETGRGLGIVTQLSHAWGVVAAEVEGRAAKIVWAELVATPLDRPLAGRPDGTASDRWRGARPTDEPEREAVLLDVPIRVYLASEASLEALLRDMQLLAAEWSSRKDRLVKDLADALRRDRAARIEFMEEARRRIDAGDDVITLRFPVTPRTPALARDFLDVVAMSEDRTGRSETDVELRHFRRWYVAELTHQAEGGAPRRCPFRP